MSLHALGGGRGLWGGEGWDRPYTNTTNTNTYGQVLFFLLFFLSLAWGGFVL